MCKVNYYLKEVNQNDKCLIYLQVKTHGHKIVLSTKLMIHEDNWNPQKQRVCHKDSVFQNSLNGYLDRIAEESEKQYYILISQGCMTHGNFRVDLLKKTIEEIINFKKKEKPVNKAKVDLSVKRYLTRKEVAAYFIVNPRTILNWEKRGVLKPTKYLNGRPRYSMESVMNVGKPNQTVY